jgi:hypothetical protein
MPSRISPWGFLSSGRANSSIAVEKQRVHFALDTPSSRTISTISLATFMDSGISALRFLTYSQSWPAGGDWRLPATINSSQVQSPLFLLDLLAVLLLLSSRFVEWFKIPRERIKRLHVLLVISL